MSTTSDATHTRLRRASQAVSALASAATRPLMLLVGRALAPDHLRKASYIRPLESGAESRYAE
ncbi:hypothetical protein [Nocardia tengchongensis]|uniref:hypothetical protein n=1 Tax=Nocardia tengchongensis TaxID=2055889 RepID=UPI0036540EF3